MEMKSGIRCHLKIPLHLKENFAKSEESRRSKDERFIFDQHFEYLLMTSLISKECYLSDNILLAAANYIAIYRLKIQEEIWGENWINERNFCNWVMSWGEQTGHKTQKT